ncbi:MAG: FeoA domain-containing protein [Erysipelotrichaceae bacterium]
MILSNLKINQKAEIQLIHLPKKQSQQLFHLGFFKGAIIQCIRYAPFNDPCLYEIWGNYIGLRIQDSDAIIVKEIHHEK